MGTLLLIMDNGNEQGVASWHPTRIVMHEASMDTLEESIRYGTRGLVWPNIYSDDHRSFESREKGQWNFGILKKMDRKS